MLTRIAGLVEIPIANTHLSQSDTSVDEPPDARVADRPFEDEKKPPGEAGKIAWSRDLRGSERLAEDLSKVSDRPLEPGPKINRSRPS